MNQWFVGVDISKDSFSAATLDAEGQESFSGSYSMDLKGFRSFLKTLITKSQDFQKVFSRHGIYWLLSP